MFGVEVLRKRRFLVKKVRQVLFCAVAFAILMLTVSGCNTWSGVGKDIQRGGEAIEGTAE